MQQDQHQLTRQILIALCAGIAVGLTLRALPPALQSLTQLAQPTLQLIGNLFISLMKMMVVPVVFVSLICGTGQLSEPGKLGRMGAQTLLLYLSTTAIAIMLALSIAHLSGVGANAQLAQQAQYVKHAAPPLSDILLNLVPDNPIAALARGHMLQIIILALLIGFALARSGEAGQRLVSLFDDANQVINQLITFIIRLTPIGVFCLIAHVFTRVGFDLISHLIGYFIVVLLVLCLQLALTYSALLALLAKRSPIKCLQALYPALLFAFSTSSSNVTIPVMLKTVIEKLHIPRNVASFVIPLGATINMDGTAIMQGVATVFIANVYHIPLHFVDYLTVITTATLASIGTAGVPGVGMITLAMVLEQVGLPVAGIALIIGIDRLLDMARTAVNVCGDATVACIIARFSSATAADAGKI